MMVTEIQGWLCKTCVKPYMYSQDAGQCCGSIERSTMWVCGTCGAVYHFRNNAENCAPACQKCQHCGTPRGQWPKGDA